MKETKAIFENKKFLIIEDDNSLAKKIERLLLQLGADKIVIKNYYDEGLKELQDHYKEYSLIILDVMLPMSKDDFAEIQTNNKEIDNIDNLILQKEKIGGDKKDKELDKAWQDRKHWYKQIGNLINRRGGIEMAKKWISELNDIETRPPVLYFSALGNEDMAM